MPNGIGNLAILKILLAVLSAIGGAQQVKKKLHSFLW
jgi:hypothetical protein